MNRITVIDLADLAMHQAKTASSVEDRARVDFAEYLRDRILDRIAHGRSADCDELIALRGLVHAA